MALAPTSVTHMGEARSSRAGIMKNMSTAVARIRPMTLRMPLRPATATTSTR